MKFQLAVIVASGLATFTGAALIDTLAATGDASATGESVTLCSGSGSCHTYYPHGVHGCVTFHDFDSSTTPGPWHLPGVESMTWNIQDFSCVFFQGSGCATAPYVKIHVGKSGNFQVIVAPELQGPIQSLRCFHETLSTDTTASDLVSRSEFQGDMAFYDPSVRAGSCGWTAGNGDMVVAINAIDMDNPIDPNKNIHCGRFINIYGANGVVSAKVIDTCPECTHGAIDVSPAVFKKVSPTGDGHVHNVACDWASPVVVRSTAVGNTGDMTYDTVMGTATGSCGFVGSPNDDMVSINISDMANGANPNDNPKCKKTVSITWNGQTHTGYVSDTCRGCTTGGIDVTETLFKKFADTGIGRLHGATWTLM